MDTTFYVSIALKILKLILNLVIIREYRNGDNGYFLGASFNKNEHVESLAGGVYVGYLVHNLVILISICVDSQSVRGSISETIMNVIGFLLWIILAGLVLHFWILYIPANHYITTTPKPKGITMGALTLVNSVFYLGDAFLAFRSYRKEKRNNTRKFQKEIPISTLEPSASLLEKSMVDTRPLDDSQGFNKPL